eukprot:TRINITY_DN5769_c0_g1_i2.p1 TRINITY_DN5769_c0_g1~~TRINITY_DN5769_c0_g1_i2.p1  ORF type:complete len:192 (-),score=54.67 TRINITY_DN5769_c0_g1_i2:26-601(-)
MYDLIRVLLNVFPGSFFIERLKNTVKMLVDFGNKKGYTNIIILDEYKKKPNEMWLIHLPEGPTARFKLSSTVLPNDIRNHGRMTHHKPEIILNNFTTRLGHTVGRMFASLSPQEPNFVGRRVITFHNQRDYIFFRHHRYIFDSEKKARLQELGPRFTLKLKSLQKGVFDAKYGEYMWVKKTEMVKKKRFVL